MENFFRFNLSHIGGNDYEAQLHLKGDYDLIGKMIAQYAQMELSKGQQEPMRVLVAIFTELQKTDKGKKIIKPN